VIVNVIIVKIVLHKITSTGSIIRIEICAANYQITARKM